MLALVLLGLVASASTAPWYDPYDFDNGFKDRMDRFWEDFDRNMKDINKNVQNIVKESKTQEWSKIEGNEYKIFFFLPGLKKEDIVVKAKKGNFVVEANHNVPGEPSNNFLYVKDLPDFVDNNGSWSYNDNLLIIFFPILQHGIDNTRASNLPQRGNSIKDLSVTNE